ncbi:RepB family plasmid replication initiator protein [bacterium]|nr:RepB family plasmid replication initiator protein [bacterium]PIY33345.1 MAG: hypothetical protein COZ08_05365 [Bacteroidetes bacterium CG_4_10_14_3_um_filter_42_6]
MTNRAEMIRHNINFLEYPIWFQNPNLQRLTEDGLVWKDLDGYTYRCGYKIPGKTDAIFLLYLLLQSQKADYAQRLTLTRYQIIHGCGLKRNSDRYKRLEDSLERWKMVGIKFSGNFYDGKEYCSINFGVIDSWKIEEGTKKLTVTFSEAFLKMMLGKGFFKFINFTEFKKIKSPLAARLYEILTKTFQGRDQWEIGAENLAKKIPMSEQYPSHIIPKIRAAISRINRNTDLCFDFSTRRSQKDKKKVVLIFRQVSTPVLMQQSELLQKSAFVIPQTDDFKALILLLSPKHQKQQTILEAIASAFKKHNFQYVARNIKYANKHATGNYRAYLIKTLNHDWGLGLQEDEEAIIDSLKTKQSAIQEECRKRQAAEKQQQLETELQNRAEAYLETLSNSELQAIREEALESLDLQERNLVLKSSTGSRLLLKLAIKRLCLKRLHINSPIPAEKEKTQES